MEIFQNIIDFVFPRVCIISDKILNEQNSNKHLSDDNLHSLQTITLTDRTDLAGKLVSENSFSHFAFYEGDDFSKIIYQLKYCGMKKLGILMGELLGKELKIYCKENNIPDYDYIIPVPLFKTKFRERGYNQSDYLSIGLRKVLNAEVRSDIIKRVRHTKSQTKLKKYERAKNVKGAFVFNESYTDEIRGKRVIVVDDVVTTGSTINEVINTLREYNVSEVMGCTLAMARE
ncbi:MAG: phosphoribosyltransferase family protein [Ignavibacteria bacterium]